MSYQWRLPADKKQAESVVQKMVSEGKTKRNPNAIKWYIDSYYMNGLRDFSNINYQDGTLSVAFLNEAGVLKLRYEDIVTKYQSQLGRLLGIDLSPSIKKIGVSLDGLRKASVAQVVLDAVVTQDKVSKLKMDLLPPLLLYGTVGVGLWIEGPESQGIEVVSPWELLPIPTDISTLTDVRGVMRIRYVPTNWIKNVELLGKKKNKDIDKMTVPAHKMPSSMELMGTGILSTDTAGGGFYIYNKSETNKGKKKDEENTDITQLVEVWTETSDGYLGEYAVYAGITEMTELYRHDHTDYKYHMPIKVIRDITVGSFWGRSYVDLLLPLNNEIEIALSSVFQAISDFDLYGLMMWPTTMGTVPEAHRGQDGIKSIRYEPDYSFPADLKPFNIEPTKLTAPMIQGLNVAAGLMDKIANQPSALMAGDAPGRMDSAPGLGLLYETSGIPISPTAKSIAAGVSGVYRALLRILKDIWTDKQVVNISNLDDSLAGIVMDSNAGTLSLSQNAIPFPDEVSVSIVSETPVSKEQQKAELKEAYTAQRISLDEFNFEVRKKGLDIPVGDEIGWQNYRRAMLENLLLFNDGLIPNKKAIIISNRDNHRIHKMVLETFMARPEFYAASKDVRDAFAAHWEEHYYTGMGGMPEQLPYMEDVGAATLGMNVPPQNLGGMLPPQM